MAYTSGFVRERPPEFNYLYYPTIRINTSEGCSYPGEYRFHEQARQTPTAVACPGRFSRLIVLFLNLKIELARGVFLQGEDP
jgi:hypothetical protein